MIFDILYEANDVFSRAVIPGVEHRMEGVSYSEIFFQLSDVETK